MKRTKCKKLRFFKIYALKGPPLYNIFRSGNGTLKFNGTMVEIVNYMAQALNVT